MVVGPQRFTASRPCPVCGGQDTDPRGQGKRCGGYLSSDRQYAHCTREEYAAGLPREEGGTYAHRLMGPCRCGTEHEAAPVQVNGSNGTNGHKPKGTLEATYEYKLDTGALSFEVLRVRMPDGGKTFLQRFRREDGQYVWRCPEQRRVLYRLPELMAADPELPVWIVEGEKDVDNLIAAGFVATTNPLGAGKGKWLSRYSDSLRGRWCILVPDNDDAGREHMEFVAQALRGKARKVQVVTLPNLPPRGDASDWLATNPTDQDIHAIVQAARTAWPLPEGESAEAKRPRIVKLADLQEQGLPPINFVVERILPEGVVLCGGRPKAGKSFLALAIALAVAAGGKALGDLAVKQGDVLYLSLEGGAHGIVPRANAMLAGGRAARALDVATEWPRIEEGGGDEIEAWLKDHPEARLVIIDTFQKVRSPSSGKKGIYEEDYAAFERLVQLAARYRVVILVMHHTRKADADDVFDTISGSTGMTGSVDALWVLRRVRGQDTATLAVTGRNLPETDLGLQWDEATLLWRHAGSGEEARRSGERREILRVMEADGGGPLTPRNVADLLNVSELDTRAFERIRKLMWLMERSGELRKEARGYVIPL